MRQIIAIFFTLLAAVRFASPQDVPENARIEGIVLDAVSGSPLSGVTITRNARIRVERPKPELLPDGTALPVRIPVTLPLEIPFRSQVQTGAEGHFLLEHLDSGRIEILFNKPGYSFRSLTYTLAPDQQLGSTVVRMVPFGVISGRVFDTKGNPVVGAVVAPFQHTPSGRSEFTYLSQTRTNDRGEFRLIDLAAGAKYWLSISQGSSPKLASALSSAPAGFLYPGVRDLSRAVAVELVPGRDTRVNDVVLDTAGLGEIRVHLRNPAGQSPKDLDLKFSSESPVRSLPDSSGLFSVSFGGTMMANNAGEFSGRASNGGWQIPAIHVDSGGELLRSYWTGQPGTYGVEVKWKNADGSGPSTSTLVQFTGGDVDVDVLLGTPNLGGVLPGRVLLEAPNGETTLLPGVLTLIEGGNSGSARTSTAAGTFQFSAIPVGIRNILAIDGQPANHYVISAKQGDRDALTDGLLVSETSEVLEIRIGQTPGKLKGKVTDFQGRPVHDATVVLASDPLRKTTLYRPASRTDQNGEYELPTIAPGQYRLYAWSSPAYWTRSGDVELWRQFEQRSTVVVVERNSEQSVNVKILDEQP